ncbi:MAG: Gfo/Idh/MocA family oxidoreductase [Acidobacteria bacterium]|nr:Gfo/Idh/MocA family oxidoreductase [Acidobacteriota bacterium]
MQKIQAAVIGTGFVGRVHVEAIRRLGNVEVAAIADQSEELARKFGEQLGVERAVGDYRQLLADPAIRAVHVCTPNHLHFEVVKHAVEAGKAVLCEKPLAVSAAEARELTELARRHKVVNATNYNLRYYPVVQHMRRLVATGEVGEILAVQGTYSQDWLFYETDYNWRLEPEAGGQSRAMADIGSHWCDMVEHVTGLKITSLCAELAIFHPIRKKPKKPIETYAGKLLTPEDYEDRPITTEDFGAILLRLGNKARGALTINQVAAGRKNRLLLEIYGTRRGLAWDGENPNELWIGRRDGNNELLVKDPSLLEPRAREYADLPGGHAEGYGDTFKQLFRRFYAAVRDPSAPADLPAFAAGLRQLTLVETVLRSSAQKSWLDVPEAAA